MVVGHGFMMSPQQHDAGRKRPNVTVHLRPPRGAEWKRFVVALFSPEGFLTISRADRQEHRYNRHGFPAQKPRLQAKTTYHSFSHTLLHWALLTRDERREKTGAKLEPFICFVCWFSSFCEANSSLAPLLRPQRLYLVRIVAKVRYINTRPL